jgi:catechol 2,3-dioxygenase-like lactoylglutathione lyase family enzyme
MPGLLQQQMTGRGETTPPRSPSAMAALRAACRVDGAITLFYYDDVETATHWYEEVIGFEKVLDHGWLAVFRLRDHAYLGLVSSSAGSQRPLDGPNKGVLLTIATRDLERWHARLFERGVPGTGEGLQIGGEGLTIEFKVRDPGGYTLEFFEWLETPPGMR